MTSVLRMDTAQDSVKNIPVQGEFTQYLTIISYGFWVQIKCASMQYMLLYSLYDKEPCIHDVLQSMRNEYPLIEYTEWGYLQPGRRLYTKTVLAMTKFTSKPLLMGPPPRATHFSLRSYHHRSASAKSAAALFFAPHPDPSRRPPG